MTVLRFIRGHDTVLIVQKAVAGLAAGSVRRDCLPVIGPVNQTIAPVFIPFLPENRNTGKQSRIAYKLPCVIVLTQTDKEELGRKMFWKRKREPNLSFLFSKDKLTFGYTTVFVTLRGNELSV